MLYNCKYYEKGHLLLMGAIFKTLLQIPALATLLVGSIFVLSGTAMAKDPPFAMPSQREISKLRSAVISTSKGDLVFELFPEDAPMHVANFKYLADRGWYKGLKFHLLYPDYIIQGGAPRGEPDGGPGYSIPAEFNPHKHQKGSLGMARAPDIINPSRSSNGSQFHVLMTESVKMDGAYTVFGQMKKGFDVLERLQQGDTIEDVRVYVRP